MALPTEYDQEADSIARRQKYAEMLRMQSMEPLQSNQMAGGYVVPINPLQGMAKMLQAYSGRKGVEMAGQERKDLMGRMDAERSSTMEAYAKALRGEDARPAMYDPQESQQSADQGFSLPQNMPAVPGDRSAAFGILMNSRDPMLRQVGIQQSLEMAKKQVPKWERVELPDGKGGARVGFVDVNSTNPISTFQEGGVKPEELKFVNGRAVSPTQTPAGTVVPVQSNPFKDLLIPGPDGKPVTNNPLVAAQSTVRAAGKPVTTVVNQGDNAFAKEYGKQDAEQLGKWREGAIAGNSTLELVGNMREAIKQGVYSGGGAEAKTAAANIIFGLTGFTPKELPGSQLFNAEASKLVLDKIKTLGANPSNADREFIEKTIPHISTSPEARDQLIAFLEKKAREQIDLFQRADEHARKNNGLRGFDYFPKRRASDAAKKLVYNPATGQVEEK